MANLTAVSVSLLFAIGSSAYATTITVTTTNDTGPGSLRQAIFTANNGDTIDFDPALNGQTITLTSDELLISKNITISGPGANLLTIARAQGASNFRIFHITPLQTVTIQGLTITKGSSPTFPFGGGILNDGATLSLINCTLSANSTAGQGGGIYNFAGESSATLGVESSTLTGNVVVVQHPHMRCCRGVLQLTRAIRISRHRLSMINADRVFGACAMVAWTAGHLKFRRERHQHQRPRRLRARRQLQHPLQQLPLLRERRRLPELAQRQDLVQRRRLGQQARKLVSRSVDKFDLSAAKERWQIPDD